MCRLAALPPGTTRKQALEFMAPWGEHNKDGVGSVHLDEDKKFVLDRKPFNLFRSVKHGLLDHLPHPGWTVVHLRAATHGKVAVRNTHPFVKGAWAVCHNGVWSGHSPVRAALEGWVEFDGETDSEVAAYLLANIGPKRFYELMPSGTYLALNRSGELWAVKEPSGDLMFAYPNGDEGGIAVLSDDRGVPTDMESHEVASGWYHFDAHGRCSEFLKQGSVVTVDNSSPPQSAKPIPVSKDDDDSGPIHYLAGGNRAPRHWWDRLW